MQRKLARQPAHDMNFSAGTAFLAVRWIHVLLRDGAINTWSLVSVICVNFSSWIYSESKTLIASVLWWYCLLWTLSDFWNFRSWTCIFEVSKALFTIGYVRWHKWTWCYFLPVNTNKHSWITHFRILQLNVMVCQWLSKHHSVRGVCGLKLNTEFGV